jgi:hypothetical protein
MIADLKPYGEYKESELELAPHANAFSPFAASRLRVNRGENGTRSREGAKGEDSHDR